MCELERAHLRRRRLTISRMLGTSPVHGDPCPSRFLDQKETADPSWRGVRKTLTPFFGRMMQIYVQQTPRVPVELHAVMHARQNGCPSLHMRGMLSMSWHITHRRFSSTSPTTVAARSPSNATAAAAILVQEMRSAQQSSSPKALWPLELMSGKCAHLSICHHALAQ